MDFLCVSLDCGLGFSLATSYSGVKGYIYDDMMKNPRAQSSKAHKASTLTRMAQQHHHDSLYIKDSKRYKYLGTVVNTKVRHATRNAWVKRQAGNA